jgi:hypothetical protein
VRPAGSHSGRKPSAWELPIWEASRESVRALEKFCFGYFLVSCQLSDLIKGSGGAEAWPG